MSTWRVVRDTIHEHLRVWLAMTFGFVILYYFGLMASVVVRLGHWPNYAKFYDYPADIWNIIISTPSLLDVLSIIPNEWVFETGYMNYDYGHGIAEWSLAIIPPKVVAVTMLGALVALSVLLLRRSRAHCRASTQGACAAASGLGTLFVGVTNITMTWVSCCSTPTWVVGLSLVGLETSSAYVLLPYGNALSLGGFAVLLATNYVLARHCLPRPPRRRNVVAPRLAMQDR